MKIHNEYLFKVYDYLYLKPRGLYEFKNERSLIKRTLKIKSDRQSIIFFTTHKCASKFFHQFFLDIAKHNNLIKFNFDEFKLRYKKYYLSDIYYEFANEVGCIYAPIRRYEKFENICKYKVILALRDPRDTLVSYYFSTLYSHDTNSLNFIQHREKFKNSDVDSFVISNSDWLLTTLESYRQNLKNFHFINYEDLTLYPESTIKSLLEYLSVDISETKFNKYINDLTPSKSGDQLYKHKRSGLSKQYLKFLKPETIEILNNKFQNIMHYYDFKV